ncbi:MAG TPA: HDOD domain-containing protein [Holophaga sp.]|nr:HDOD domain-containing protein [Holophaga sp.]
MIPLLRNLFGRKERPASDPPERQAAAPRPPAPAAEPDPFDPVWALLEGASPAGPRAWTEAEEAEASRLTPLVLDHFSRNKPAPTAFPALAVQIMDLLNDPDVDMARLLKAISPDPAISINVLRVANSALYGRGTDIADLRMAVMRIGLRGVGEIAAGVAGRTLFDVALRVEYEAFPGRWHQLFLDTMAVAFSASQYAFELHAGRADRAFLAGMFHDIGKSLALRSLANLAISGQIGALPPDPVIDEVLERVHVEVGGTLHDLWGLPAHLKEACLRQHDPDLPGDPDHAEIHVLRLAAGLRRLVVDPTDGRRLDETRQSLATLRLGRRQARLAWKEMGEQIERVKVMFPA